MTTSIIKIKEDINSLLKECLNLLVETNDDGIRNELALLIVNNFKSKEIIPTLISLIKRKDLKRKTGTLIFACNEYSPKECKEYLEFFVNIVIMGSYESSWSSAQLILDFPEPYYDWKDSLLNKLENKLLKALDDEKNKNKEFIEVVLRKIGE